MSKKGGKMCLKEERVVSEKRNNIVRKNRRNVSEQKRRL